jgi:hypothetical protein
LEIIDRAFDQLGPTPRLCFETPSHWKRYICTVDDALGQLTLESLRRLLYNTADLAMDTISHRLFLVRREDIDNVDSIVCITHITPFMQSKLAIALRDYDSHDQIRLYRTFARTPSYRGMTGSIFEAFCQQHFQKQISIHCVPMVCLNGDGSIAASIAQTVLRDAFLKGYP